MGFDIKSFLVTSLLAALYFLPSVVATARRKRNAGAITLLNLFLGWTILGWIIALIWSATHDPSSVQTRHLIRRARR